ncbi:hypothetical protein ACFL0Q_05450 [Thermodesulfobacteriota bacterium]
MLDHDLMTISFNIENRPPDANSVYVTDINHLIVDYVLYDSNMTLNCPNYKTKEVFIDPDSDDGDNVRYVFEFEDSYNLYECGNVKQNVSVELKACDVCSDLKITLLDQAGLMDQLSFDKAVRCNALTGDTNQCCGADGCWEPGIRGSCGYGMCEWEDMQYCPVTKCECVNGAEVITEENVVIMERQFADMCNACGNCMCSGYIEPRFRDTACPPSEECGECGGGKGLQG